MVNLFSRITLVLLLVFGNTLFASNEIHISIFKAMNKAVMNSSAVLNSLEELETFKRAGEGIQFYFPSLNYHTDLLKHSLMVEYNINRFLAIFTTNLPHVTEERLKAGLSKSEMMTDEDIASLFFRLLTVRKTFKDAFVAISAAYAVKGNFLICGLSNSIVPYFVLKDLFLYPLRWAFLESLLSYG